MTKDELIEALEKLEAPGSAEVVVFGNLEYGGGPITAVTSEPESGTIQIFS